MQDPLRRGSLAGSVVGGTLHTSWIAVLQLHPAERGEGGGDRGGREGGRVGGGR